MFQFLTVALFAVAQPGQAPRPPQAPPIAIAPKAVKQYADYRAEAVAAGLPIVIFVRCEPRPIAGAVVCRVDHLDGYDSGPNIVIGVPDAKVGMRWKATLERDASDAAIRRELQVTQSMRLPFSKSLRDRRTADDNWLMRQLPFLAELEPYESAKRVQVTFRREIGYISSVPREESKPKWKVAGGLEGVHGWSNELFKKARASVSLGYVKGDAITWQPAYEDGSVFADVLRNEEGAVFEVRVAEKSNGIWERYVAYRDASAFPLGYSPVRRNSCRECHAEAGDTAYGGAAVPGGDTILSDPIPQVESGQTVQGGFGLRL